MQDVPVPALVVQLDIVSSVGTITAEHPSGIINSQCLKRQNTNAGIGNAPVLVNQLFRL
ncbi:hypothetical protein [Endozoicomonas ascidiicola]|uniref:hypothetical protein n=1 Tax=Endozoicomonas ascidiicola TaxID=1698521 RepID=UPI001FDF3299|nr:hypothetical protein [Endozoicomonas ascidiicola]